MRINKYLAQAGVASRRKAEDLIKAGDVTVNGKIMTDLAYQVKSGDAVEVKQTQIYKEEPVYYILNKPRGVISSVSDEKDRKTVLDFFRHIPERIYPVGRLDWDTSGLLLLTNDGDFSNLMTHPSHQIEKVYIAKVEGQANKENLRPLTQGVKIDGRKTKPAIYHIIKQDVSTKKSVVQLTIQDRKSTRLNSSHQKISYAVFCL